MRKRKRHIQILFSFGRPMWGRETSMRNTTTISRDVAFGGCQASKCEWDTVKKGWGLIRAGEYQITRERTKFLGVRPRKWGVCASPSLFLALWTSLC